MTDKTPYGDSKGWRDQAARSLDAMYERATKAESEVERLRVLGDALHDQMGDTLRELGWHDEEAVAELAAMKAWRDGAR